VVEKKGLKKWSFGTAFCEQFPEWESMGDTPAFLRKSVEALDGKRVVKHS
jgi:hypothetical protein